MKHNLKITIMLLVFFLSAQYIGLLILSKNIDLEKTEISGETTYKELPIGERPPLEEKNSYWTILGSIFVGTILLLLLIKLNWIWVWKIWFVMAVFISLSMALGSFIRIDIALLSSLILAVWKVF
ncbi:hypothetical protein HYX12_04820, partial [Candidatus Woesearchaeota archaeon]|nr:hypothetical protein [Candidatus Woesearchaeota archaeon]